MSDCISQFRNPDFENSGTIKISAEELDRNHEFLLCTFHAKQLDNKDKGFKMLGQGGLSDPFFLIYRRDFDGR